MKTRKFNIRIEIPKTTMSLLLGVLLGAFAYLAYGYRGVFWTILVFGILVLGSYKN